MTSRFMTAAFAVNRKVGAGALVFMLFLACASSARAQQASASASDASSRDAEWVRIIAPRLPAGSAHRLEAEHLQRYADFDVHRVLSAVPGVHFRAEEGYGLRPNIGIRGAYSDRSGRITLMEDGVLIAPAPYSAPSAYYFPTVSRMSGVEVLKGPSAITEGPYTIGGALNLISTPIPESDGGSLIQEIGDDGLMRSHVTYGLVGQNFGALIEVQRYEADGFDSIRNSSRDTGFQKNDQMFKLRFDPAPASRYAQEMHLKWQKADEASDQTYLGLAEPDFKRDARSRYGMSALDTFDSDHESWSLRYQIDFGRGRRLEAVFFENEFERDWFKLHDFSMVTGDAACTRSDRCSIGSVLASANNNSAAHLAALRGAAAAEGRMKHNARVYESRGWEVRGDWELGEHVLEIGWRRIDDSEDRFQYYEYLTQLAGGELRLGVDANGDPIAPTTPSGGDNRLTESEGESRFLRGEFALENDLHLALGYRRESYETEERRWTNPSRAALADAYPRQKADDSASLWGASLSWRPAAGWEFFVGQHQGFSPTGGDADPEEADNLELGARRTDAPVTWEVVYFDSDYENLVGECKNSNMGVFSDCAVGDTFDGGAARVSGFEASVATTMRRGGVLYSLEANYTSTDAEFRETFASDFWGNVERGDEIPYLPDSQMSIFVGAEWGRNWSAQLRQTAYGDTCSTAACGAFADIDSYATTDVFLNWTRERGDDALRLYARVTNLTDEEDLINRSPNNGARSQAPRSFVVGAHWRF